MQLETNLDNTMKILDTLTRVQSNPISINELRKEIKARYGRGHYPSIYNKIQFLEREKMIRLERIGKASIPRLNLQNYFLIDLLTALEMKKKQNFMKKYPDQQLLLIAIEDFCKNLHYVNSISIIDPERNKKLNRTELLILLKGGPEPEGLLSDNEHMMREILEISGLGQTLQSKYNTKIDCLILTGSEFCELAGTEEINPLREMLSEVFTFFSPENYWREIKKLQSKGIWIKPLEKTIIPALISDRELIYNLARFGYKEFGHNIQPSIDFAIEYIVSAILQNHDSRLMEAIPIILAKNDKEINYRMLIFLCRKYKLSQELLDLLQKLNDLKSTKKTKEAISILESITTESKETLDKATILEKMKLYNAL